jgi:hypothetical protein
MEQRMAALAESHLVQQESLGKTLEGRDIWLLRIAEVGDGESSGEVPTLKPAFLILGNVYAPHLVGREIALRMAEQLVAESQTNPRIQQLLDKFTLYFIPVPSPDAAEKNFRQPYREVAGNARTTDDDRDFSAGEDPPTDLNQDGWVTLMRIHDSLGTHRSHPADPRVLIEVDRKANEPGAFRIYTESLDSDQDGQFGEDPGDGVDFNRNFTFNYEFFGRGSGHHQVSEVETRAIADFAFDQSNIGVVFCFSPEDNLFHPWKSNPQAERARIKTSLLTADSVYTDYLAKAFQQAHGGQKAPASPKGAGSFSEWAYFHYGRWSFASRGWWIPEVKTEKEAPSNRPEKQEENVPAGETAVQSSETLAAATQATEAAQPRQESDPPQQEEANLDQSPAAEQAATEKPLDKNDKRGEEDLNALAWLAQQGIDGFAEWTPIEHPNFPGLQVEVGGFKPFLRLNPPVAEIDRLVQPHLDFLIEIEQVWPSLEFQELKAIELAPGLYDVSCKVVNRGFLPTMPEMGRVNLEWYPIQVTLNVPGEAKWLQGSPRQRVGKLEGQGGSEELRWLFQLPAPLAAGTKLALETWSPTLPGVRAELPIRPATEASTPSENSGN